MTGFLQPMSVFQFQAFLRWFLPPRKISSGSCRFQIIPQSLKFSLQRNGLTGPIVGHAGDGNFHASLMFDPMDTRVGQRQRQFTAAAQ